ncbi:hypothetical protein APUTEX25_002959 [Auxenochlorella protothecoides]|uniref:XPG-I domain-containing protein n=1 Tax=Auxenochlorella protothecoides TaxID=3075 RepID=A0A3M7L4H4_AUXPR|nr:hypothetical protein APUTEX25_002959 [Auxenochlorella protothecoides]|eukprot:RMZ56870.1 hypothetical protein APUTEX25_002959 [Auxenochlorella protothecoides]
MGIASLWKLLTEEGVVRKLSGSDPSQHHTLLSELDGTAIAVDLSAWIMQADQQLALLPHFGRTERCMKVALERSIQWLRHGCLPVIVVEGRAPAEKLAAVQARYAARNGVDGGGRGSSSFIALGKSVGVMLQQLGLPVFYSPGEAEATCAALVRAGRVDAAASFDSDTMVHGAERVYHTLKLSTLKPGECELVSCDLGDIRKALGIQRGGQVALSVIAMLAGSDYDLVGTSGVGSDDSGVLEALEALVARPPDAELAALTKCTGCKRCGHEGGRKGAVARHTPKNPCPCCAELDAAGAGRGPAGEEGDGAGAARAEGCRARAFARCDCAFHRREAERGVEAIAREAEWGCGIGAALLARSHGYRRSGGRGGARPAPASPETQGLLARLLVQQRARALLGPKPSAGPAVARGPDSAVLAAARGVIGASPRKRGLREAGGGGGPASPAGAALLQGAGTQRSPAKSADIRRYVEQGSPGRLGATACEGGELDLTTPEGCCRSPAIDLTQT